MNQTPIQIVFTVVVAIAFLALIGFTSLCVGLFIHVYADQAIITSIMTITGTLIGYLGGILSNPRQAPTGATTTQTTTQTVVPDLITPIDNGKNNAIVPVSVVSSTENPVHTTEDTKKENTT